MTYTKKDLQDEQFRVHIKWFDNALDNSPSFQCNYILFNISDIIRHNILNYNKIKLTAKSILNYDDSEINRDQFIHNLNLLIDGRFIIASHSGRFDSIEFVLNIPK